MQQLRLKKWHVCFPANKLQMKQELRLFRNFMRNWDRDIDDCAFFDIFANGNNTDALAPEKVGR